MIRHIVFFTANNEAHIDQIIDGLSLLAAIPHSRRLEVARNRKTDQLGNDIDIVLMVSSTMRRSSQLTKPVSSTRN